jgi:alcohol dehydrogenase
MKSRKLSGATTVICVDALPERLDMARRLGADHVINIRKADPVAEIMRITDGRGVDVAIEALGAQATFEGCLRGFVREVHFRASGSTRAISKSH